MITIAICDDDLDFAQRFSSALKSGFHKRAIPCTVALFNDVQNMKKALDEAYYDIIVLDIRIGNANGIALGNFIRDMQKNTKSQIVFVSSYDSYHLDGKLYSPSPMAFICKPFTPAQIEDIVDKAQKRIVATNRELTADDYFVFKFNRQKYLVIKADIVYIEGQKRQKIIHTLQNEVYKKYELISNMKDIIKLINSPDFVLIHQSFLVNIRFIDKFGYYETILKTGQRLAVAASHYQSAHKVISEYLERDGGRELSHV